MIVDADDFGSNHIISDICQTRDCRKELDALHYANGNFKITLFAVPGEMTAELCEWCKANNGWVELAVHGVFHKDNYECNEMTYDDFDDWMDLFEPMLNTYFVKGFKAPGWQIGNDVYRWLSDHDYWIADQAYNNERRPKSLPYYVVGDDSLHLHTWNCCGNGIEESFPEIEPKIRQVEDFKFISEVLS